jgi:O-acetyl-ADP-ribose deacetylase (regulator of RNase III)
VIEEAAAAEIEETAIAVETVADWLNAHPGAVARVIFNVFKDEDKAYYEQLLK